MITEYLVYLPAERVRQIAEAYPAGTPLPLHCTVMPWFCLGPQASYVSLSNYLMTLACGVDEDSIELVSEEAAMFGPNKDVPVHMLRQSERLNLLHTKLLVHLASTGSAPQEHWRVGAGYRPHVTNTERYFDIDRRYVPKSLVLVERDKDKNIVIKTGYKLGDIPC